jgi:hypothetical protein
MESRTITAILYNSSECELDRVSGSRKMLSLWLVQQAVNRWLENITDGDTILFEVSED